MFFLWLALNVFYVLKVLSPPEWLVDEGKKRRCEERVPPGLVTPLYWPGDPHLPASLASGHLPRGRIARPLETAACGSAQPKRWENTPRGSLTATHLLRRDPTQPAAPLAG